MAWPRWHEPNWAPPPARRVHPPGPPAAQTVTVGALVDQSAVAFAPRIDQQASGAFVNQAAAAFAPQVNLHVTAGFVNQAAQAFAPGIVADQSVAPALVNQAATAFAPQVNLQISGAFVNQAAVAFAPLIGPSGVSAGFVTQAAQAFAPTIQPGNVNVVPALTSQVAVAFEPEKVQNEGVFAPTVNLSAEGGFVNQAAVAFAPTVTAGGVSVAPNLVSQAATAFAPTRIDQDATFPTVTHTAQAFAPQVNLEVPSAFVNQAAVAFSPTVEADANFLLIPFVSQGAIAYAPTVVWNQTLTVPFVSQAALAFEPFLSAGSITSPGGTFKADFFPPPSLVQILTVPLVVSHPRVFAPSVAQGPDPEDELEELLLLL